MPVFKNIQNYHAALIQNSVTCTGMVKDYLEKIAAHQHLNAFVEVYEQEALQKAAALGYDKAADVIKKYCK